MTSHISFNPDMFRIARDLRETTQAVLSKKAQIPQGILSQFEHALRIPDEKQILAIANALDFPVDFFVQQGTDSPTGIIFHRKRSVLKVRTKLRIEAEVKLRLHCLKLLLPELDIEKNVIKFDLEEFSNNPLRVAQALRHFWKVSSGPIKNLTELLEDNGIAIIRFDFGSDLLDGFFIEDELPCIAINSRFPGDRQRFTLAHELGHLVMHSIPHDDIEDEANKFASEFLMPQETIDEYFRNKRVDIRLLAALKPIWRVSMAALLRRAKDLGYITESNAKRLIIEMNACGYRKKEPIDIPLEKSSLSDEIVEEFKSVMDYSDEDLSKIMHLKQQDYMRFFLPMKNFPLMFALCP